MVAVLWIFSVCLAGVSSGPLSILTEDPSEIDGDIEPSLVNSHPASEAQIFPGSVNPFNPLQYIQALQDPLNEDAPDIRRRRDVPFSAFGRTGESDSGAVAIPGAGGSGEETTTTTDGGDLNSSDGSDKNSFNADGISEKIKGAQGQDSDGAQVHDKNEAQGHDKNGAQEQDKNGAQGKDKNGAQGQDKNVTQGQDKNGAQSQDKTPSMQSPEGFNVVTKWIKDATGFQLPSALPQPAIPKPALPQGPLSFNFG